MKTKLFSLLAFTYCFFSYSQQNLISVSTEKTQADSTSFLKATNFLERIRISGYIQTQYEYGDRDASLKVGTENENALQSFNRFGIRRGRLKFMYEKEIVQAVFQIDLTEQKIGIKDAYLQIHNPWLGNSYVRAGMFNRPFGQQIAYSSSRREPPERAMIFQTLFPDERDLGFMFTLQASEASPWSFLKLKAGLFAGNGINLEIDSKKDFIGQLTAKKSIYKNFDIQAGLSYYNGKVYQGTENIFRIKNHTFILDNRSSNKGAYAKREYIGADFQIAFDNNIGNTQIRTEYIFGTQPGAQHNSKSPNASSLPENDSYIRSFEGGYITLIQNFNNTKWSGVMNYDWYNPNTKLSGDSIGLNYSHKGDIAYRTIGFGAVWDIRDYLRIHAYYDIVKNETSKNLEGYEKDLKDNHFTLRLQIKF